jgi:hypothetical protein
MDRNSKLVVNLATTLLAGVFQQRGASTIDYQQVVEAIEKAECKDVEEPLMKWLLTSPVVETEGARLMAGFLGEDIVLWQFN